MKNPINWFSLLWFLINLGFAVSGLGGDLTENEASERINAITNQVKFLNDFFNENTEFKQLGELIRLCQTDGSIRIYSISFSTMAQAQKFNTKILSRAGFLREPEIYSWDGGGFFIKLTINSQIDEINQLYTYIERSNKTN